MNPPLNAEGIGFPMNAQQSLSDVSAPPADKVLQLSWSRGNDGAPCRLTELLSNGSTPQGVSGVYLLWTADHCGSGPNWIYVGEGRDIADRLERHSTDPRVQAHACREIRVAWAAVPSMYRPGVLCYLAQSLLPMVAEPIPAARAIPVNLPL